MTPHHHHQPRAYYNEHDRFAAEWLRQLIHRGVLPQGDVDERDIRDVTPDDLAPYTQCHFFAGIGTWAYSINHRPNPPAPTTRIWSGSPPCQPFSAAGGQQGFADERHLWPHFHHLIRVCRPERIFGEQVASKDGLAWLDLVQADMEGEAYAFAAVDLCAAGAGAPHIRQRLLFTAYDTRSATSGMADTSIPRHEGLERIRSSGQEGQSSGYTGKFNGAGGMADTSRQQHNGGGAFGPKGGRQHPDGGATDGMADSQIDRRVEKCPHGSGITTGDGTKRLSTGHESGSNTDGMADAAGTGLPIGRGEPHQPSGQEQEHKRLRASVGLGDTTGTTSERHTGGFSGAQETQREEDWQQHGHMSVGSEHAGAGSGRLGDTDSARTSTRLPEQKEWEEGNSAIHDDRSDGLLRSVAGRPDTDGMADTYENQSRHGGVSGGESSTGSQSGGGRSLGGATDGLADTGRPCPTNGFWRDADWLFCRDGKWRPTQPSAFEMVDGSAPDLGRSGDSGAQTTRQEEEEEILRAFGLDPAIYRIERPFPLHTAAPARVGRLRGYGNGVVEPLIRLFIDATMESETT